MAVSFLSYTKYVKLFGCLRNNRILSVTSKRSIMSTRPRLEKVLENLQKNPYYEKYSQKIAKLQQTSPEEFLERVGENERIIQEEKEKRERCFQRTDAKPSAETNLQKREAKLSDIMKVELIEDKTSEEISQIWQEYHKHKDCIAGILTVEQYERIFELGGKYPTFLLPLPREKGYEFIMVQFHGSEIHMTPLLWFQTHKENAPECLTMIHYCELKDKKGIVLMRGEFDIKSIDVQEAQCLANELQLYYSADDPKRLELIKRFTEKPDSFKHMDLIAQLETISLTSRNKNTKLVENKN